MQCPKCHFGVAGVQFIPELKQNRTLCSSCGWMGPPCFGEKWNASSPKCRGGNDPTYWDEHKGHKRDQCSWYRQCAQETAVRKEESNKMMLPVATAVQQPTAHHTPLPGLPPPRIELPGMIGMARPQPSPPAFPGHLPGLSSVLTSPVIAGIQQGQQKVQQQLPRPMIQPRTTPQPVAQVQQPQHLQQSQFVPMGQQANMPAYIPQNFVVPGQQIGFNLTNPEPIEQGWWAMTGWSVARGAMKGGLWALLGIIDNVQIGPYFQHRQ